tara:strand:- start:80 stop:199 length:120 start_codon:yes stop_codon:yes gene_type:complete
MRYKILNYSRDYKMKKLSRKFGCDFVDKFWQKIEVREAG